MTERTSMSTQHITTLLECCLKDTYFLFQGKYYEQVNEAATGSTINPTVANLFIEEFETKAISTGPHQPRLWLRYVDDTFVIQKREHSQQFSQHINSTDPHIQFTAEVPNTNGSIPYLDTSVISG